MARIELTTIGAARVAVKTARAVYIQPRFGVSEHWMKVTKVEALELLSHFATNDTPEAVEMFAGSFGTWTSGGTVYLG